MALRCVIVDDNAEFLASARRLLESQGLEVAGCASSAAEAIRLVDEAAPDLALVDVHLGDEDGIALADELVVRAPATAVVLISSHDRSELSELLEGSRAVGFLAKTDLGAAAIARLIA